MGIIFDGNAFAKEKEKALKKRISKLKPKLISILVGDDKASALYTKLKQKAAKRVGIKFEIKRFNSNVSKEKIVFLIKQLNKDKNVQGIMVQLPLPKRLRSEIQNILDSISPEKDIDGLTKNSPFIPATTKAIIRILGEAKEKLREGKEKVVVVGEKGTVGKSVMKELKNLNYDVTGVDIETEDLKSVTEKADILISTTGVPNLIKGNMVKDGVVIIDVGSPHGDVLFNEVIQKASFITPVPGGIGPVTIISLLENLIQAILS